LRENVLLAPFTTLRIGGNARYFVSAADEDQVVDAFRFATSNGLDLFVLGGGSNVLIADAGFDGLVLQVAPKGVSGFQEKDGSVYVTAQAGEDWDRFVELCVAKGLQGIECLSGIPGFVGGTPVQNVGAYGQEVSETIVTVRAFDRESGEIVSITNAECGFSYRTSIFNTTQKERFIVLSVTYALTQNGFPKLTYKELKEMFGDRTPSLSETRDAVLDIRRAKSMVIDAADPNSRSAGSFFKNPLITAEDFALIEQKAEEMGAGPVPFFPAPGGNIKVPAAWLIEKSGFSKGYRHGRAGLSSTHTLAVVNLGGASAADIMALKDKIKRKVYDVFSIDLQKEPVFVGFRKLVK
jgi:UDP-N-acetylmuramate dehydrogenase